ncbi:hypothetical protein, putative Pentapeptide repeats [Marinobacter nauticus ATCC 49840]|nr:hypothetical protein, putative Pentapeptide repeats [Marinobacter nauticus ATCC 49840]
MKLFDKAKIVLAETISSPTKDSFVTMVNGRRVTLREGGSYRGLNLSGADLRGANLENADFEGANLTSANLENVRLKGANLRGVQLFKADLSGADLSGADLTNALHDDGENWLKGAIVDSVAEGGANGD